MFGIIEASILGAISGVLESSCFNSQGQPRETEFEAWKRDFQRRIDEEKQSDPKTTLGWALKAFR